MVAVIDSGIDYTHPDLAANIWTNPGEIAGNGLDDDGNGYVDDVHGYDFPIATAIRRTTKATARTSLGRLVPLATTALASRGSTGPRRSCR